MRCRCRVQLASRLHVSDFCSPSRKMIVRSAFRCGRNSCLKLSPDAFLFLSKRRSWRAAIIFPPADCIQCRPKGAVKADTLKCSAIWHDQSDSSQTGCRMSISSGFLVLSRSRRDLRPVRAVSSERSTLRHRKFSPVFSFRFSPAFPRPEEVFRHLSANPSD